MVSFETQLRDFFKRWPRFYYFIANIFGPMWFSGLSAENFLHKYISSGKKLNLGSGPRILGDDIINVDIFPFPSVKMVADISRLPLSDDSVSQIVCDNVLEHVENPAGVIAEIYRVLEKGGTAYFCNPFLYPFHASPNDFFRWTDVGFLKMIDRFELLEKGVRSGIFSALSAYLCYLLATLFSFGSKNLYWLLVNLSIFIFFPIKLLDAIFCKLPFTENTAAILFYVVRKK